MTIFGAVKLLAAAGVWAGNQLARWFAVAVVGLNAIAQMFFIPAYPFWSLLIIAVDIVALWGLCAYGSRENMGMAYHCGAGERRGWDEARCRVRRNPAAGVTCLS